MTKQDAADIIRDRVPDCGKDEVRDAWQLLVNTGDVWQMSPWHVQMAQCLLSAGVIERNAG